MSRTNRLDAVIDKVGERAAASAIDRLPGQLSPVVRPSVLLRRLYRVLVAARSRDATPR
jgi:hypothetical protein